MATAPNQALAMAPPVYGLTEAAKALNVSISWIQKLRAAGVAQPTVPVGASGRMVFSHDDLRRLAAAIGRDLDHDMPREAA